MMMTRHNNNNAQQQQRAAGGWLRGMLMDADAAPALVCWRQPPRSRRLPADCCCCFYRIGLGHTHAIAYVAYTATALSSLTLATRCPSDE